MKRAISIFLLAVLFIGLLPFNVFASSILCYRWEVNALGDINDIAPTRMRLELYRNGSKYDEIHELPTNIIPTPYNSNGEPKPSLIANGHK